VHERDVERRDAAIAELQAQLAEVEQQFDVAVRAHLRAIDRLIEIQDGRLLALEQEFTRDVRALEEEFAVERADVVARHNAFRAEMAALQHELRVAEHARRVAARAEFEQRREAVRKANMDRISVLHNDMQTALDNMAKKCEDAHAAYLASTDQRTHEFKVLSQRGQRDTAMNERQQRALKRLTKLLQTLRSKMANNVRECEERNETLEGERDHVAGHLEALKAKMAAARAATDSQLKATSTAAQAAKAQLTAHTALAQRLLVLAETVRAAESGTEKAAGSQGAAGTAAAATGSAATTATPASSDAGAQGAAAGTSEERTPAGEAAPTRAAHATEQARVPPHQAVGRGNQLDAAAADGHQAPLELLDAETTMHEAARLEKFYARYNKVLLETLAVERRRDTLRAENTELQAAVQHMLEGLSVSDATLQDANPLFVVNGRMPHGTLAAAMGASGSARTAAGPGVKVSVPVVEAAVVFNAHARTANAAPLGGRRH
jgi:hypothetical protein